jgi:acetylornithine deacetylase/succinyl-diaminopimelate desuccinylase-like protein
MLTALLLAAPTALHAQANRPLPRAAATALNADYDRTVAELIRITETPAPPFKERVRAELFAKMLRDLGLKEVEIDAEGNVTALRPGTGDGRLFAVSAHLDTVFPEGTPIKVRREGDRLMAPGIGDDSLGLASLLAWARALDAAKVTTKRGILFVGTVGEEGAGDLRGVRHLFTKSRYKDRIGAFMSVDGSDASRIVNAAVGSRRYRLSFTGPGGHSYGAFGTVNPMAAMADTVRGLYAIDVPKTPKTTYAASVVSGGTSVNAIPDKITLDIDMRSPDKAALATLESRMLAAADAAVTAENAARSTRDGSIEVAKQLIGDRPAGDTDPANPLVVSAMAAARSAGLTPKLESSSTDSNIPMSLDIPALTIGSGASGGRSHSLDEFLDVERGAFVRGLSMGLTLILDAANR